MSEFNIFVQPIVALMLRPYELFCRDFRILPLGEGRIMSEFNLFSVFNQLSPSCFAPTNYSVGTFGFCPWGKGEA
jgi:hypothetical protein